MSCPLSSARSRETPGLGCGRHFLSNPNGEASFSPQGDEGLGHHVGGECEWGVEGAPGLGVSLL